MSSSLVELNGLTGVFIVKWLRVILDHMVRVLSDIIYRSEPMIYRVSETAVHTHLL